MEEKKSQTIKQYIYDQVKSDICQGKFPSGMQIHEQEIANRFLSSRSPVREALRQLVSDGLVVEYPNRGVFVRKYSGKDIEDIFDLRCLLEGYAIRRSGRYITMETVAELNECKDKLKAFYEAGDIDSYTMVDSHLHHKIIELSGNDLVISTYERTSALTEQFRIYSLRSHRRFDDSVTEHCEIIERLLEGNAREAERIDREHLGLAKDEIKNYLLSIGELV